MNNRGKPSSIGSNARELIRVCNEKMVCAARDLAKFTKAGINASFIVALAHKCEALEDTLNQPIQSKEGEQTYQTAQEIQEAVEEICDMGRKIWFDNPRRYQDYVLPLPVPVRRS